ncbi:MAG: Hsp70 family protein, partial [Synergistaceae bacterium]|nr:Hsp70 family protein [Synergistaceae bacterium]
NGILNVSAKDKGTGKEQKITIQSSNLSKDDIERMKRDAEDHASEDEKKRSAAENKNEADGAVFQAEKLMRDLGDKMTPEEKGRVNSKIDALKKAIESGDEAGMKSGKDDLMKTMQEFGARLYQNNDAGAGAGANPNAGGKTSANDSDTVDAEFSDK